MKQQDEIERMIEKLEEAGEDYCSSMSYYEGVMAALEWTIGSIDEPPVED